MLKDYCDFSERPLFVWMLGIATAVALPVVLDPNPLVSAVIGAIVLTSFEQTKVYSN